MVPITMTRGNARWQSVPMSHDTVIVLLVLSGQFCGHTQGRISPAARCLYGPFTGIPD